MYMTHFSGANMHNNMLLFFIALLYMLWFFFVMNPFLLYLHDSLMEHPLIM